MMHRVIALVLCCLGAITLEARAQTPPSAPVCDFDTRLKRVPGTDKIVSIHACPDDTHANLIVRILGIMVSGQGATAVSFAVGQKSLGSCAAASCVVMWPKAQFSSANDNAYTVTLTYPDGAKVQVLGKMSRP